MTYYTYVCRNGAINERCVEKLGLTASLRFHWHFCICVQWLSLLCTQLESIQEQLDGLSSWTLNGQAPHAREVYISVYMQTLYALHPAPLCMYTVHVVNVNILKQIAPSLQTTVKYACISPASHVSHIPGGRSCNPPAQECMASVWDIIHACKYMDMYNQNTHSFPN